MYYADATSLEALGHAHLSEARALVLLMNDPSAAQRVTDSARRIAPGVPILTRARYLGERDYLLRIGATDVVAEEVEGGVEMLARLLRRLTVPPRPVFRPACVRRAMPFRHRALTPSFSSTELTSVDPAWLRLARQQRSLPLTRSARGAGRNRLPTRLCFP